MFYSMLNTQNKTYDSKTCHNHALSHERDEVLWNCYIKSLNLNSNVSITIYQSKFEFRFKLLM